MVTGMGTAKSATATMALGLDPRFDLSKAYWMVAGIAGIDPEDIRRSVAWSSYLVDGDLGHEIDAREIPEIGTLAFLRAIQISHDQHDRSLLAKCLRQTLGTRLGFELTKDAPLVDPEALAATERCMPNTPMPANHLRTDRRSYRRHDLWHGKLMNDWANRWVSYWSDGETDFVTSAGGYRHLSSPVLPRQDQQSRR